MALSYAHVMSLWRHVVIMSCRHADNHVVDVNEFYFDVLSLFYLSIVHVFAHAVCCFLEKCRVIVSEIEGDQLCERTLFCGQFSLTP